MTRVAAVILSHNDAATVAEAVRSIGEQARAQELCALLLADDGSRDDTVARARAAGAGVRLDVLEADRNLGQWSNLNRSLQQLDDRADWVLILHADDVVAPGWLEAMLGRIENCGEDIASICSSWHMLYDEGVRQTGEQHDDPVRVIGGGEAAVHDTLLSGCWCRISGVALRLSAFRAVGRFDGCRPLRRLADARAGARLELRVSAARVRLLSAARRHYFQRLVA